MSFDHLLSAIDAEITRLQQACALLSGGSTELHDAMPATPSAGEKRGRRKLSAEARKRIAEAQRKRWAAQKKAMGKRA